MGIDYTFTITTLHFVYLAKIHHHHHHTRPDRMLTSSRLLLYWDGALLSLPLLGAILLTALGRSLGVGPLLPGGLGANTCAPPTRSAPAAGGGFSLGLLELLETLRGWGCDRSERE